MAEKFHTELQNLRKDTLDMAHLGRDMLRTAVDALIRQDPTLAESVILRKGEIHDMEVNLEEHCYHLIALNQPMAKDMRVIACTLKVINASLRIGRYGKVIAKIVKEISDRPHIANLMSIPHMADLVIDMVDDAIAAYESDNLALIRGIFSPGRHGRCITSFNLPGRNYVHDGRPEEYLTVHPLHHGRPVSRTLCRPCLHDCRECSLHGDRGKN